MNKAYNQMRDVKADGKKIFHSNDEIIEFYEPMFFERIENIKNDGPLKRLNFVDAAFFGCDFTEIIRKLCDNNLITVRSFWHYARFRRCNFISCNFAKCNMMESTFHDCYFFNDIFDEALLQNSSLTSCDFECVSMKRAHLNNAEMIGSFYKVNFEYAAMNSIKIPKATGLIRFSGLHASSYDLFVTDWGADGVMIKAGCRWFSEHKAICHWNSMFYHTPVLGRKYLAAIEFAKLMFGEK